MYGSVLRALSAVMASLLIIVCSTAGSQAAVEQRPGHSSTCIFDHMMLRTASGVCRPKARVYPANVQGRVKHAIYDSALIFGVPYPILLRIARCESGLNPQASYSGHYGLFQFLPDTFHGGAQRMHVETGIAAHSYWNPADSSYVAGYLFAIGKAPSWGCLYRSPS
jgi:hypothetical protein